MDTGSNKSLFTLIAVVIFGIFLSLSYWLFQDEMKNVLANVMDNSNDSFLYKELDGSNYPPVKIGFYDSTGNLLQNSPLFMSYGFNDSSIFGESVGSVIFNGSSYLSSEPRVLTTNNSLTLETVITPYEKSTNYRTIFSHGYYTDGSFSLRMNRTSQGNKLVVVVNGSTYGYVISNYSLENNKEYYVSVTFDGINVKIYINGELVDMKELPITLSQDQLPIYIGYNQSGLPEYWKGEIEMVNFYDKALTDGDISNNYTTYYNKIQN